MVDMSGPRRLSVFIVKMPLNQTSPMYYESEVNDLSRNYLIPNSILPLY